MTVVVLIRAARINVIRHYLIYHRYRIIHVQPPVKPLERVIGSYQSLINAGFGIIIFVNVYLVMRLHCKPFLTARVQQHRQQHRCKNVIYLFHRLSLLGNQKVMLAPNWNVRA